MSYTQEIVATKKSVSSEITRVCHNRYHSVATEMMATEIQRVVTEIIDSGTDSERAGIPEELLKALSEYTRVPARNIAIGPDIVTLLKALHRGVRQITYVGPVAETNNEAEQKPSVVIPSLVDSRSKDIARAIPANAEILYLSNPNSLNGEVYNTLQIRRILDNAGSALVVVDESLFEYCGATCIPLLKEYDKLVVLRTLTEAFGLEQTPLAYALGAVEVIETLTDQLSSDELQGDPMSYVTQVTALAALGRQDVMRHALDIVCENRVYLTALLRRLGAKVIPTPTNVVLIQTLEPEMSLAALGQYGVTLCEIEREGEKKLYLRIPIGNDRYCRSIVAALTRCPREYYRRTPRSCAQIGEREQIPNLTLNKRSKNVVQNHNRQNKSLIHNPTGAQR